MKSLFCSSEGYSEPGQISTMKLSMTKYKFMALFFNLVPYICVCLFLNNVE